ncbi:hypothetical protein HV120_25745 (plasmid) [Citrobacter freundii]|uniref:hypothetical protein n=1 Tax=Citrobacter freundii TaxID=546 RepID=UPI0015F89CD0|nr:hypothetical protein [Citrobacter freundii]MBA7999389.1 hypothetical protein [Citrobacter freundii]
MSGILFRCWPWGYEQRFVPGWPWGYERRFVPVLAVGDMSGVLFRCWPWGI